MDISYKNKNLERICTCKEKAKSEYGARMAVKIMQRINEITAAESVEEMIQFRIGRCHQLTGYRCGEYAVDLVQPYRLVFIKVQDSLQLVRITEITDYH